MTIQRIQQRPEKLPKLIERVLSALLPYGPEKIYVFGSWAAEEQDELSDLDLVVIKKTKAPFFSRLREVSRMIPPSLGGLDILVYTPAEFEDMVRSGNAFAEMILEEGKLIYAG